MAVSINCDMGEGFSLYQMGDDAALMPYISHANIACGFHASDFNHMRATVKLAKQFNVKVGAHPSLPDLQGFGRREMKISREELANCILYQVGALKGFAEAEGVGLSHLKPHGALYGMAARSSDMAQAVCDVAEIFKLPVLGMGGTCQEKVCRERGVGFIAEFFADLDYSDDGDLIITRVHEAKDPRAAAAKCVRAVVDGVVRSTGGRDVPVRAETICIHSDTPDAAVIAKAVHEALLPFM